MQTTSTISAFDNAKKRLVLQVLFVILLAFVSIPGSSAQTGAFQWAKGIGADDNDYPRGLAVDGQGNSYAVGAFKDTTDLDPGPAVYNLISSGDYDIYILKLNSTGQFVWGKSIGGTGYDFGNSIVYSAPGGGLFIAARFTGTVDVDPGPGQYLLTGGGSFLSKLDINGNFIWAVKLGGSNSQNEKGVAVDAAGNVIAIGTFSGSTTDFDPGAGVFNLTGSGGGDVFVAKFDASGNFLWAGAMGSNLADEAFSVVTDNNGNMYITGNFTATADVDPGTGVFSLTSTSAWDVFIVKLTGAGNFTWARQFGGTSGLDRVNSMAVSSSGAKDVFITGSFGGTVDFDPGPGIYNLTAASGRDIFVYKLDSSGNFRWVKAMGGGDEEAASIELSPLNTGAIYTTGYFSGTTDFDPGPGVFNLTQNGNEGCFISKLDSSGNFAWAKKVISLQSSGTSLKLDPAGHLYILGYTLGDSAVFDGIKLRNSAIGLPLVYADNFVTMIDESICPVPPPYITTAGITTFCVRSSVILNASTGAGFTYQWKQNGVNIAGATSSSYVATASGDYHCVITNSCASSVSNTISVTVNSSTQTFQEAIGGSGNDVARSLIRTSDGGYVFVGTYDFLGGDSGSVYVVKLNSTGGIQWTKAIGQQSLDEGNSIAQTSDGGYAITGRHGYWTFDMYVIKLDAAGNLLWSSTISEGLFDIGISIIQTTDGGLVIGGRAYNGSNYYGLLVKLNSTGGFLWSRTYGQFDDGIYSVVATYDGGFALAGTHTPNGMNFCLVKTFSNGAVQWQQSIGGSGFEGSAKNPNMLILSQDSGFVLTGSTSSFGAGGYDMYVVKFNKTGSLLWTRTIGGTGDDEGISVIQDNDLGYIVSGSTNSFGAGGYDAYLVKLDPAGAFVWSKTIGASGNEAAYDLVHSVNCGGIVFSGSTTSFGNGGGDVYVVETDANFNACANTVIANSLSGTGGVLGSNFGTVTGGITLVNLITSSINSTGTRILSCASCTLPPTASITAGGPTTFCTGGTVTLNANTGIGLSYQWKLNSANISGANSSSYTATASGNYQCIVSNACGATPSNFISVTVNLVPTVTITGPATFCAGSSVMLFAQHNWTNVTLQWKLNNVNIPNSTGSNIFANTAGNYTCTITHTTGCSGISNVFSLAAVQPPTVTVTSSNTGYCSSAPSVLTASTAAGNTLQWYFNSSPVSGATTSTYTASAIGSYICSATNATCGSLNSNTFKYFGNSVAIPTVTPLGTIENCSGGYPVNLTVSPASDISSGPPSPYAWKRNDVPLDGTAYAGPNWSANTPGSYSCTVRYSCGTANSGNNSEIKILPASSIPVDGSLGFYGCQGNGINVSMGNFWNTYQWQKDGVDIPSAMFVTYYPSLPGYYRCRVSNNCSFQYSDSILVDIVTSTITPSGPTTYCQGNPITLTAPAPPAGSGHIYNYTWYRTGFSGIWAQTQSISTASLPQGTFTYTVYVSTSGGCNNTPSSSITINVLPTSGGINASGPLTFCSGGSVTLNAVTGTGFTYQWIKGGIDIPGANSDSYSATLTGSYTCRINNTLCSYTSNAINVTVNSGPSASITSGGTVDICQNDSVTLQANIGTGLIYQWQRDNVNIPGGVSSSYTANTAGNYACVVTNNCGSTTSNIISVSVNQFPLASISAAGFTTFCLGGSVLLTANTGTGLTHQWKLNGTTISGATSSSYSAGIGGSYTCLVSNACGGTTSNAIAVTINLPPTASITAAGSTSICIGRQVGLNANTGTGLSYQWKDNGVNISGATSSVYGASTGGNFSCEVTNACGSTTSNAIVVTLLYPPSANITAQGSTAICPGSNVKLISDTAYGVRYQWMRNGNVMPAETLYQYTATAVGNYTCEVSNLCDTLISNTLTVTTMPLPSADIFTNNPTSLCSGSTAKLNVNTDNGLSFQWQLNGVNIPGATGLDYTTGIAGNYTCVVTGPCGTTTSNTITLTSISPATATISATGPTSFCAGGSVTLNANTGAGLTHQWKLNGSNITGATTATYNATAAGNYTCVVSNVCGGATSNSITVTISSLPSAAITAGGSTTICQGNSVTLNANAGTGLTYQWKLGSSNINGATASIYNAIAAGSYTCVVTNGCGSVTSNSIAVTINPLPTATITAAGSTTICTGGSVTLNANTGTGLTYQWKRNATNITGATASSYNATTTGSYTCAVTNTCGTATSNSISVTSGTSPATPSNISGDNKVCPSSTAIYSVTAVSGVTFNWTAPSAASIISGQGTNTVTVSFASNFNGGTLSVTASNPCGTSSARTKSISKNNRCGAAQGPSLPSNQRMLDAVVFPNPASDHFTLTILTQEPGTCRLIVHDLTGRVVEQLENISPGESVTFGHKLSSGVYLVEVIQGEERKVLRVVKNM